jgi:hypothetical protein
MTHSELTGWVESMTRPWQQPVAERAPIPEQSGPRRQVFTRLEPGAIAYTRTPEPDRVAWIIRRLLTFHQVDEFACGEVWPAHDQSWTDALDRRGYEDSSPVRRVRWFVHFGNHRLRAQELLGIGPYAYLVHQAVRWR